MSAPAHRSAAGSGALRVLLVDNYDSFTFNLVHLLQASAARLGVPLQVDVRRNDALTVAQALAMAPDGVVISPGPDTPAEAGITVPLIRAAADRLPIFGVCLGHQSLAVAFGGRVKRAGRVMHGKSTPLEHDGRGLFRGVPSPVEAMRYHSLVVDPESLPESLEVSARLVATAGEGEVIMGLRHRTRPIETLQFHPESVGTPWGATLGDNAVRLLASPRANASAA